MGRRPEREGFMQTEGLHSSTQALGITTRRLDLANARLLRGRGGYGEGDLPFQI